MNRILVLLASTLAIHVALIWTFGFIIVTFAPEAPELPKKPKRKISPKQLVIKDKEDSEEPLAKNEAEDLDDESARRFADLKQPKEAKAPPEDPKFFGSRDLTAATELPPDKESEDLIPTTDAKEEARNRFLEIESNQFQDGDLADGFESEDARDTAPAPSPFPPADPADPTRLAETKNEPAIQSESPPEPATPIPAVEAPTASEVTKTTLSDVEPRKNSLLVPEPATATIPPPSQVAKIATPAASPAMSQPPVTQAAYQEYKEKRVFKGSLTSYGVNSLDTEKTVLGEYQSALLKSVGRSWQRACRRHRDFIVPSSVVLEFSINRKGTIPLNSVNVVRDRGSSEIMKSFTIQSIVKSTLPKLPQELKLLVEEESLEFRIEFFF